jgi:hypothetical protein
MAYNFPEGSKFQFSSTFAAPKTVTIASNAATSVLTAVAHGLVDNDEFLFTSGWEDASNSVYKADQLTADTLGALGLDTTSTTFFAPGTGIGTLQKVSNWTDIPQVLTISNSGGDARFTTVQPLASRNGIQIPTGFNAASTTLTLAHDPSLANYQTMVAISRTQQKVAFRIVGGGGTTYGYGYMSVSETPQMQSGQVNQVQVAISMLGRTISY